MRTALLTLVTLAVATCGAPPGPVDIDVPPAPPPPDAPSTQCAVMDSLFGSRCIAVAPTIELRRDVAPAYDCGNHLAFTTGDDLVVAGSVTGRVVDASDASAATVLQDVVTYPPSPQAVVLSTDGELTAFQLVLSNREPASNVFIGPASGVTPTGAQGLVVTGAQRTADRTRAWGDAAGGAAVLQLGSEAFAETLIIAPGLSATAAGAVDEDGAVSALYVRGAGSPAREAIFLRSQDCAVDEAVLLPTGSRADLGAVALNAATGATVVALPLQRGLLVGGPRGPWREVFGAHFDLRAAAAATVGASTAFAVTSTSPSTPFARVLVVAPDHDLTAWDVSSTADVPLCSSCALAEAAPGVFATVVPSADGLGVVAVVVDALEVEAPVPTLGPGTTVGRISTVAIDGATATVRTGPAFAGRTRGLWAARGTDGELHVVVRVAGAERDALRYFRLGP